MKKFILQLLLWYAKYILHKHKNKYSKLVRQYSKKIEQYQLQFRNTSNQVTEAIKKEQVLLKKLNRASQT